MIQKAKSHVLFLILLICPVLHQAQVIQQLGDDIDGQSLNDVFGNATAISTNGEVVAAGAWNYNHPDSLAVRMGNVRVFERDGSNWNQLGNDLLGHADEDRFGLAMDLSADGYTIIIGSDQNSENGMRAGKAQVFDWTGTTWEQRGASFYGDTIFDWLGTAVSISHGGDTIAIGAPGYDIFGAHPAFHQTDLGKVRTYAWDGFTWQQFGSDLIAEVEFDGHEDMHFGSCIRLSASGHRMIVGAPLYQETIDGGRKGQAKVFEFNNGEWVQIGQDFVGDLGGSSLGDRRELDISDDGNRIAVGSANGGMNDIGRVLTYDWNGTEWVQVGQLLTGDFNYDFFGVLSLSGDGQTLLVGAHGWPQQSIGSGNYVRLFEFQNEAWVQLGETLEGEANGDRYGASLSLSDAGVFVVGGPENDEIGDRAGHIRIFSHCSTSYQTEIIESCETYTWRNGVTYTESQSGINYTQTSSACDTIYTLQLTIHEGTAVSIIGLSDSYSLADNPVSLNGEPEGGIFSGPGVMNGVFDPVEAGVGSHELIYTYTNAMDCQSSMSQWVQVNDTLSCGFELIISGVYDGSMPGGFPKGVELYAASDIDDLSAFGLGSANNGGGTDGEEFSFEAGAVSMGTFLYVASDSENFEQFFGFAPDAISDAMSINGDDALELYHNGEVIDVFGDINNNGFGEAWEYTDGWAYRLDAATPNNGVFDSEDWIYSGTDALDNVSQNTQANNPVPVGSFECTPVPPPCQVFATDVREACDSFTWIDGMTYTESTQSASHTVLTEAGCDSIISLELTILYSSSATDVQTSCEDYIWIDGQTYSSSNSTATHVMENAMGCDSVIHLDLTIVNVNTEVMQNGALLSAEQEGADYQWYNCENNEEIEGAVEQTFEAEVNGEYYVSLSLGGCTENSACYVVTSIGLEEQFQEEAIRLYPNPSEGQFFLEIESPLDWVELSLFSLQGRMLKRQLYQNQRAIAFQVNQAPGLYWLRIESDEGLVYKAIVLE